MPARMRVLVATIALLVVIFLSMPSAHAQLRKLENVFSLSPADFTIRDAPPLGEPYLLESKLVIRNGDTIKRNFILSVRAPSRDNLEPGYEPIPDVNWFILIPASIEIQENSSDMVEMALNIPRWENLTDQRWEAWISVTRMAEPGEILEIEYISKAYIETTKELPPPPSPDNWDLLLPLTIIIILVVGVVGTAFLLARHRRGEKEPAFLQVLLTQESPLFSENQYPADVFSWQFPARIFGFLCDNNRRVQACPPFRLRVAFRDVRAFALQASLCLSAAVFSAARKTS